MIFKLGNIEDVKVIPNLCLGANNALSKFTRILTEMYGADRDVDHDMGGYVLYAEKGTSINELKNAFNYEENTFEYVQRFENDVIAAIYIISTEFAVVLVMHLDDAPDIILSADDFISVDFKEEC